MPERPDIAIIGATGKVGSAACEHLRARNRPFVTLSRRPGTQNPAAGMEQRHADMDRPETLVTALEGVRRVLLCGPDHPAQSAGVELLVKLSAQCASLNPPTSFGKRHARSEQNLRDSGLPYLVLSPMLFAQSVFLFGERLGAGKLRLPLTGGRVCYVDARDVGEAACNCLIDPPAENRRYILSGPAPLSVPEVLSILSDATGRPVTNSAPPKLLLPFVLPLVAGLDYSEAVLLKELMVVLDKGVQSEPTQSLPELLGRSATDFAAVARSWAQDPGAA